jgi:hypothetical protein
LNRYLRSRHTWVRDAQQLRLSNREEQEVPNDTPFYRSSTSAGPPSGRHLTSGDWPISGSG